MTEPGKLTFDFDDMKVGEITLLELTINRKMREEEMLPPGRVVTFQDVMQFFRSMRGGGEPGDVQIPFGFIAQAAALVQVRRSNPDATWEDAGELELEVRTPKGAQAEAMIEAAAEAAALPPDPLSVVGGAGWTPPERPLESPETAPGTPGPEMPATTTRTPSSGLSGPTATPS